MTTPAAPAGHARGARPVEAMSWRAVPPLAAALALGLGALFVARILIRPIAYLVLAITIGEAVAPLVARLERRVSRGWAIAAVYAGLAVVVGLLAAVVVPGLIAQGQELAERAPALVGRARELLDRVNQAIGGQVGNLAATAFTRIGPALVALPLQVLSILLNLLLIVFLSIYWLSGAPALKRFVLSLFPADRRPRAADVLGVLTMLGEPIPYIGPIIAAVPVVLVALLESPTKALLAIALYTALQQVEGNILTPYIMRRQTQVPGALVLFALLAGSAVGGLLGALVALPVAGAVRIFAVQVVAPAVRRRTGAGAPRVTPAAGGATR